MTGHGKPGKRTGASTTLSELDACHRHRLAVKRIACNVSQRRIGANDIGSHVSVMHPLDMLRHQRSSGAAKPPGRKQITADRLILMGVWRDSFAAID